MTDAEPRNVIEAIAAVMRDVEGIDKGMKSEQGYKYRGIEQITAALQPLLGKHRIVFVPRAVSRFTKDITINSKPWTEEQIAWEYTVYGPGGREDFITVGPIFGFGRDNSDKGANKSASQAFKYALLQVFCIGDAKDDGDQQSHATDAPEPRHVPAHATLAARVKALPESAREAFPLWLDASGVSRVPKEWSDDDMRAITVWAIDVEENGHIDTGGPREPQEQPEPSTGDDEGRELESGVPVASGRTDEQVAEEAGEDAVAAEIERVRALKPAQVKTELEDRGLDTEGNADAMRKRLVLAVLREQTARVGAG